MEEVHLLVCFVMQEVKTGAAMVTFGTDDALAE